MCESNTPFKEAARELAESEQVCNLAKKLEFGHIILLVQNRKVVTVKLEQTFR